MKKITWLFMSLMLFLGMGKAFAGFFDTDPTYAPASGAVTSGQEIVFTWPEDLNLDDYSYLAVLYSFDEDCMGITASAANLQAFYNYYVGQSETKPNKDFDAIIGVIDGGEVTWTGAINVPTDATVSVSFMAVAAAMKTNGTTVDKSEDIEVHYTVSGGVVTPTKPAMPTFSPASGAEVDPGTKVTISAGADADYIFWTTTEEGEPSEYTWETYEKPITINEATTLRAASAKGNKPPFTFSDVATATYTLTDKERTGIPTLTVAPTGTIPVNGSAVFSCTLNPQEYTHTSGKIGFGISLKNGADVASLEFQVGETVDPDAWAPYEEAALKSLKGAGNPTLAAIPTNASGSGGRVITIEAKTVHYRLTLPDTAEKNPEIVFSVVEVSAYGMWPTTDAEILATASVKFQNVAPAKPIMPNQDYIKFTPYPKADLPENIAKGNSESVYLRPVNANDVVYYRILSVDGADQNAPIDATTDTKVETRNWNGVKDYEPIKLTEDLVNARGQFVVKAAAWIEAEGKWSPNVIAAYNVVFGEHVSATELAFVSGEPTELMIGETYEMQLSLTASEDSLALHGNTNVNLIINWDGGIDFADVQYKFAEADDWTPVDEDDLKELIRIPNTFKNFAEKGVWMKWVMSRKKRSDEMMLLLGITRGESFLSAKVLSSVIDITVPCVNRPAAEPVFSPKPGYIAKGSAVTITCATSGTKIYYTTDGTEPTASSTEYTAPVTINGLTTLKAIAVTTDGGTSFVSEAVYSVVPVPVVTPASGRVVYDSLVKITFGEGVSGVDIYYTTDGTEPSATNGTKYTEPFHLRNEVIKVIAVKDGDMSAVITREYTLIPATPVATPGAGTVAYGTKVKLECATPNVEMYWRIGGGYTPLSKNDTRYTEEIEITETCQLKVIAYYGDATVSTSFSYTVLLAAPEFSVPEGKVEAGTLVTLSSKSMEANTNPDKQINISYTTDGSDPDKNSTKYTAPIEITETVTIKAVTWSVGVRGVEMSAVETATYTVDDNPVVEKKDTLPMPKFNPVGGEVEKGTSVVLSCDTANAKIYYSIDADTVTVNSLEYTAAIVIDTAKTIRAIAVKEGLVNSKVAVAVYTIKSEGGNNDTTANESKELTGVSVYPNPNNGMFHIELPVAATVDVFASNGVLVKSLTATEGKTTLSLNHSGIYFVRVMAGNKSTVKRVIVR
ncbi:MAG: chitobiase/beta-hexosaminidase C-terminal domain-containing protein [Bacteroidales bacterium]|nr:chitobiase/beta-hexosaminidase C-terminal domain-containing protein [Bacteroidales bacterium]